MDRVIRDRRSSTFRGPPLKREITSHIKFVTERPQCPHTCSKITCSIFPKTSGICILFARWSYAFPPVLNPSTPGMKVYRHSTSLWRYLGWVPVGDQTRNTSGVESTQVSYIPQVSHVQPHPSCRKALVLTTSSFRSHKHNHRLCSRHGLSWASFLR